MATLLIVDDDEIICDVLLAALEKIGHRVIILPDGRRVGAVLAQDPVDLLLIDILMPNKEGVETIREIRGTHPALPIIAMSVSEMYLRVVKLLGVNRTILKPFNINKVLEDVGAALAVPG